MSDRINLYRYRILRKLQYLQEQEEKKQNIKKYLKAKAHLEDKKEIEFNDKKIPVDIDSDEEAEAIIDDVESSGSMTEIYRLDIPKIKKLIKEAILKEIK